MEEVRAQFGAHGRTVFVQDLSIAGCGKDKTWRTHGDVEALKIKVRGSAASSPRHYYANKPDKWDTGFVLFEVIASAGKENEFMGLICICVIITSRNARYNGVLPSKRIPHRSER